MNDSSIHVSADRNISRALARSRSVRASVARRRRRIVAFAACAAVLAGAPVAWFMAEPAAAVASSAASEIRDLAQLLGQRSPGARTQALLNKHARVAAKARQAPKPKEAVGHLSLPRAPSTEALVDLFMPPIVPVEVASNAIPPIDAAPTTLSEILNSTPGGVVITPPGGGGSVRLPTTEPKEVPPPSAVPEPNTWALMLLGFGLIGWRMRRRNVSKAPKPAVN